MSVDKNNLYLTLSSDLKDKSREELIMLMVDMMIAVQTLQSEILQASGVSLSEELPSIK